MMFGTCPVAEADGAILAHSMTVGAERWPKGRHLSRDDVETLRANGIREIVAARLEPSDVAEDVAATRLGTALAGAGIRVLKPLHGRVNLIAGTSGVLRLDQAAVDAVNAVDESLTLGTLAPLTRVAAGDVVATIKVIPYAVDEAALTRVIAAARRLSIAAFRPMRVRLIQTELPGTSAKMLAKTERVTRDRLAAIDATLASSERCGHAEAALAALLRSEAGEDIVLVAGASATVDRRDVVPAAIVAAGGRIERLGMPVDPGNLLCLGESGGRIVIGLPGCARSPKRNGVDLVLERLAAGLPVDSGVIAAMGVGGLLPEAERPEPRLAAIPTPGTGVVVLAAGRSSRMEGTNKLLADLGGRPVLAHVLDAVAAAELPALVVVGNMAEVVSAVARGRAEIVVAPDFAEGLSRSLRAGIAAVPEGWGAAIVCLGDMPELSPGILRALVAANADPDAVVVPTFKGKRGNPVLWNRAHFERLMTLSGDVGGKALLSELADHVIELEVESEGVLADIDTPEALAAARARYSPS